MTAKAQLGPTDLMFPIPAALIACGDRDYQNVLTVAWIGMVDSQTVGIGLLKNSYSLGIIREKQAFSVNIPPTKLLEAVDYCGIASGRSADKWAATGLTARTDTASGVPIVAECPVNLECRLLREIELENLVLLLGKITETYVDADKVTLVGGQPRVDPASLDPIVFFAVADEYWSLGRKLGDAFVVGKALLP